MHGRKLKNVFGIKKRAIREYFGNKKFYQFPNMLYGHCSYCDGAISFGWEKRPHDFVVDIFDSRISKKDCQQLKTFAKRHHKSLYIRFRTYDMGGSDSAFIFFCLKELGKLIIADFASFIWQKAKERTIKYINYNIISETQALIELKGNEDEDEDTTDCFNIETSNKEDLLYFADELGKKLKAPVFRYDQNGTKIYDTKTSHRIDVLA